MDVTLFNDRRKRYFRQGGKVMVRHKEEIRKYGKETKSFDCRREFGRF